MCSALSCKWPLQGSETSLIYCPRDKIQRLNTTFHVKPAGTVIENVVLMHSMKSSTSFWTFAYLDFSTGEIENLNM